MANRPNFLIIVFDGHGPMWSSGYGHPFVKTPNMERLAAQSVVAGQESRLMIRRVQGDRAVS